MDIINIEIEEIVENITIELIEPIDIITIEISEAGSPGPQGIPGNIAPVICGQPISSGNIIYINGGKAYKYDTNNPALQNSIYGIALQAGLTDEIINAVNCGIATVSGWGLIPGAKYYAAPAGGISTTPAPVLSEFIGVAISADSLLIKNLSILTN